MSKTLGLALGAGGARGVAHIGFLKALEENGIKPDYIAGSSMGAVVGGCYAKGMHIDDIRDIVLKIKAMDILDISPMSLTKLSLLKSKKVQRLFLQYLGDVTFDQLNIPFTCTAVDLLSGKLVNFTEGSVAVGVQASSCIPSIFRPVHLNGQILIDGGVLCRVPIEQVRKMGADVVVAVDVLVNTSKPVDNIPNIFSMLFRVYDIMDNQLTQMAKKRKRNKCELYLEPEMEGMEAVAVKYLDKAYQEGYEIGIKNIEKIKELLKD
ncbi:MAG: patatin-like phospholipase family protein [Clostridia bacterium]|nr:patatin-like phospholipase family protein [Clostridia bacterium]